MTDHGEPTRLPRPAAQLDVLQVLRLVRDGWLWIVGAIIATIAAVVVYLNVTPYLYTAQMTVTPVQQGGGGGSRLGALAGLASAAGVNVPQDPSSMNFDLYLKGIASRTVAERLARQPQIMETIFASEWTPSARTYRQPPKGVLSSVAQSVKAFLGIPVYAWHAPDAARLQEYLQDHIKTSRDPKVPFVVTLEYQHPDPKFAVLMLARLHAALDDYMRQKAKVRAEGYIDYLTGQLAHVTLTEHRAALAQSLSDQEKTHMMASSGLAFAAEPFGPPTSSLYPTSPRPTIALVIGAFVGLVLGIGLVLARYGLTRPRELA